jgi:NitT/TauT family transport system ATP-binding protein
VYQNVYSVCRNHEIVKTVLSGVLLWEEKDKHPSELSGGMARRVAIARALAFEHDILILDEPFKGLDQTTRQKVAEFISSYEKDNTILMVTHDKNEAECINAHIFDLI